MYLTNRSFTLEIAQITKGYEARTAERLLAAYPNKTIVTFAERGGNNRSYLPRPSANQIIYVKSTGGRWGKSKQVRI